MPYLVQSMKNLYNTLIFNITHFQYQENNKQIKQQKHSE